MASTGAAGGVALTVDPGDDRHRRHGPENDRRRQEDPVSDDARTVALPDAARGAPAGHRGPGAPVVLAVHGITASGVVHDQVAAALAGRASL